MQRLPFAYLAVGALATLGAAPVPIADLWRLPAIEQARLSPDGKHVAFLANDATGSVTLFETATGKTQPLKFKLNIYDGSNTPTFVTEVRWLGSKRLLLGANFSRSAPTFALLNSTNLAATIEGTNYAMPQNRPRGSGIDIYTEPQSELPEFIQSLPRSYSGFTAVDLDGKKSVDLPGIALRTDRRGGPELSFAWDARRILPLPGEADGVLYAPAQGEDVIPPVSSYPVLARIDTRRGTASQVVANPGKVTEWLPELGGKLVLGIEGEGATTKIVILGEDGKKWTELADLGEPRARLRLEAFDGRRGIVFGSRLGADGRWELAGFHLKEKRWLEPIERHERYDIGSPDARITYASVDPTQLLFSPKTGALLAYGFVTDGPRQQWIEPRLEKAMTAVAAVEPGTTPFAIGIDEAETKVLVAAWSARHPGFYALVDLADGKVTRLGDRMPWIKPAELGEMFPTRCNARDGVELDVYLTLPPGATPKGLPLVLLLRDQPWQRTAWGFQAAVQSLATRGFAVLQVNHRGSSGYGTAFAAAGNQDIDRVVPGDLIDAVRWAVAQGVADPGRIGVVGSGFGGSCALALLARAPDLFRCGATIDAVTDWREIVRLDDYPFRYWSEAIGATGDKRLAAQLEGISPLGSVAQIRAPVLLVHNERDTRTVFASTKSFAAALKKNGTAPETFFHKTNRFDRIASQNKSAEAYERIAAFLGQHLARQ